MGPQSVLRARIEDAAGGEVASATGTGQTSGGDEKRDMKCIPYKSPTYPAKLKAFESFMHNSKRNISPESRRLCKYLLEKTHDLPRDSLFNNTAVVEALCEKIQYRNESRILRSITPLLVPSGEDLALIARSGQDSASTDLAEEGSAPPETSENLAPTDLSGKDLAQSSLSKLELLAEGLNERWTHCFPITHPRPQPEYSISFDSEAYTADQLARLRPFIGDLAAARARSFFMGTRDIFFPFLTCEVKSGAVGPSIADNQNAHSMTVAVRGIVHLFRQVNREKELDRQILAFSISHNDSLVRFYGHYAEIHGKTTKYYRHKIREFTFTTEADRWTAYHFTQNIYIHWMPQHLDLLYSAIDMLPLVNESDFETLPVSSKNNDNSTPNAASDSFSAYAPSSSNDPTAGKKNTRKRRKQKM